MQTARAVPEAESPSMTVLAAVARRTGVDVADLEAPLYEAIDPDALDRLLQHGADVTVTFEYSGYRVSIDGEGTVAVEAADGGVRP